jgi:hypothetical protein
MAATLHSYYAHIFDTGICKQCFKILLRQGKKYTADTPDTAKAEQSKSDCIQIHRNSKFPAPEK